MPARLLVLFVFLVPLTGAVYSNEAVSAKLALSRMEESLSSLQPPEGYRVRIYWTGLDGPDGLALSNEGRLVVCEELAGRVLLLEPDGARVLVEDLDHPEGVCIDGKGNLYVVEDVGDGRLLRVSESGEVSVLADRLSAPEGVAVSSDGTVYVSQSTVQLSALPLGYRTWVTAFRPEGLVDTLAYGRYVRSYSGLAIGPDGLLYVCNEASGVSTWDAVVSIDPRTGQTDGFCRGPVSCEGLCFQPGGDFPMLLVEEDVGGGSGRLSIVSGDGRFQPFASGFGTLEDVVVDGEGRIFVTQDSDGTVLVIYPDKVERGEFSGSGQSGGL
ncbi:hypothetical protein GF402_09795 [Candidatus Fermentibacteria bacterium]|nr:hypothetical protein [Candidatus Fermentibacteria bacterium]